MIISEKGLLEFSYAQHHADPSLHVIKCILLVIEKVIGLHFPYILDLRLLFLQVLYNVQDVILGDYSPPFLFFIISETTPFSSSLLPFHFPTSLFSSQHSQALLLQQLLESGEAESHDFLHFSWTEAKTFKPSRRSSWSHHTSRSRGQRDSGSRRPAESWSGWFLHLISYKLIFRLVFLCFLGSK